MVGLALAVDEAWRGVDVAVGVAVAGMVGTALEVTTLDVAVVAGAGPVAAPSVPLPVEHAATSDVRASDVRANATGTVARDGRRQGTVQPNRWSSPHPTRLPARQRRRNGSLRR